MAVEGSGGVPRSIHALLTAGTLGGLTDGQLIERFLTRDGDVAELAFSALMDQHGPMVLRVCRGVLRNEHDAEDAFQATFLILARKARSIQSRTSLAAWLFGVAYHVAIDARDAAARRRVCESKAGRIRPQSPAETTDDDASVVREELARLPARYREAVLLCSIECLTQQQAAERLGLPLGTVQSRLARGRDRLRDRLARRGLAPASALVWASADSARAALPAGLRWATLRGALQFADGASEGMISAAVAELTQGGLRLMFFQKVRMIAGAVVTSLVLTAGAGVLARQEVQAPAVAKPDSGRERKVVLDAAGARRLALEVLAQSAAIDELPRFSYRASYRHGQVDSMRSVDPSLEGLRQALNAPVLDKDWIGWYVLGFSWDETRFIWEMTPGKSRLHHNYRFWTRNEGWERQEANNRSSVSFTRGAGPARYWKNHVMFDLGYLRVAFHRFWWGRAMDNNGQTMSLVPPEDATWTSLGTEAVGGETCDVLDAPLRSQRFWVGRDSGRLRAVLTYEREADLAKFKDFHRSDDLRRIAGKNFATYMDYAEWAQIEASEDQLVQLERTWREVAVKPGGKIEVNEYVAFDDYREIAPGVWLPFHEIRAFPHTSEIDGKKHKLIRSELRVEEVRTDRDLAERFAELKPKEGDPVQDQRFLVPIDTKYSANTSDDEIRKRAEVEYAKRLEGQELIKRLVAPIAAMVGKPAPALPATGWVGGAAPDVTGKPYMLHFWATWCGPCKNDLPLLKKLAEQGMVIVGMHPPGTPAEEVEQAIRDESFGGPTFLETAPGRVAGDHRIGGYAAGVFPYYVLVDALGRVAGHGSLSEIMKQHGPGLKAEPKDANASNR